MSHPHPATVRVTSSIDVSALPTTVFGSRDLTWWGTLSFMVIEGMTLVIMAATYLYLKPNFTHFPPAGTPLPSLGVPTFGIVLYLASIPPIYLLGRAAKRMDLGGVRRWLVVASVLILAFAVVRGFEFTALNVRHFSNAYGSAAWLVLGFHFTLVIVEVVEVIGMALIMWFEDVEPKHFTDASDIAFYWYFLVGAWIPLYALVFLLPYAAG
ncbi:MAG TPA: hypothetical protein VFX39_10150 [Gemmatimonadaceae bacterium]|nr:hypothetical protein [Gemmatimonadaceae bacterium]